MKRALPSYDDLVDKNAEEDGEIIEDCKSAKSISVLSDHSEDEEYGLKAVLPVGKYNENSRKAISQPQEKNTCALSDRRG